MLSIFSGNAIDFLSFVCIDICLKKYIFTQPREEKHINLYFYFFSNTQMKTAIFDFLEYEQKVLSRNRDHLQHNKCNLIHFAEFLRFTKGYENFSEVGIDDVNKFLIHIKETPIQNGCNKGRIRGQNTLAGYSNTLRGFFKYWKSIGKVGLNREQIPMIPKERKTMDRVRPEEYQIFRQAPLFYEKIKAVQLRNQLLIDIPRNTGLRRSEILRTTFENFDSPTYQFEILGKGGYVDGVCFNESIKNEVQEYFEEVNKINSISKSNLIFVSLSNHNFGNKMNEKSVNLIFQKYSKKLIKDGLLNREITPHMERHSFATNCVLSGLSQQATTKLMRHRNPTTTLRYYHMNNERLGSEYAKIKL